MLLSDASRVLFNLGQARGHSQTAISSCAGRHSFDIRIKMILVEMPLGFRKQPYVVALKLNVPDWPGVFGLENHS